MKIIIHRQNTIKQLDNIDNIYGVEIDIRTWGEKLILHHDPYIKGELFEDWITHYKHGLLILNVKEEGLEKKVLDILKSHKLDDFFFLDQSFPFLIKTSSNQEMRSAVRLSEYESIETVLNLKELVKWVWIDHFSYYPINLKTLKTLKKYNFNLCLVSPELQGYDIETIKSKQSNCLEWISYIDAVCTKNPNFWNEYIIPKIS